MVTKKYETKTRWFIVDELNMTFETRCKARTLRGAFNKSIAGWKLKALGYESGNSRLTCGLCDLFHTNDPVYTCWDCPIADGHAEKRFCLANIPFNNYTYNVDNEEESRQAASDEVKFLEELRDFHLSEQQ